MRHRGYFNSKISSSWSQNSRNRYMRSCTFRFPGKPKFSPAVFLKHLADRVARALRLVSARRRHLPHQDSSFLGRSNSKPAWSSVDSHRTDAVEDCIEFIHSSFSRSNSSTTPTCEQDSGITL